MKRSDSDAAVFQALWTTAEPVTPAQLHRYQIAAPLWIDAKQKDVITNEREEIIAFRGLSVEPTSHRLDLPGRTLWTWCAFDGVGIMAAFEASGTITSVDPHTGTPLEINVERGRPISNDAVVFVADAPADCVDHRDWCPNVNFFEGTEWAELWANTNRVTGHILSLMDATALAARNWERLAKAQPAI